LTVQWSQPKGANLGIYAKGRLLTRFGQSNFTSSCRRKGTVRAGFLANSIWGLPHPLEPISRKRSEEKPRQTSFISTVSPRRRQRRAITGFGCWPTQNLSRPGAWCHWWGKPKHSTPLLPRSSGTLNKGRESRV